jgi:hypothetical protein
MERPYDIQDRAFLYATEIVDFCRPALPPGMIVRELARHIKLNSERNDNRGDQP